MRLYWEDFKVYAGIDCSTHETFKDSVDEYVRGQAHFNGDEPLWAVLKRVYHRVCRQISKELLNRYVSQFAGKHILRALDTVEQMTLIVLGMSGIRLIYKELIA